MFSTLQAMAFPITADNRTGGALRQITHDLRDVRGALAGVHDYARRAGRTMRNIGGGLTAAVTAPLMLAGRQMVQLHDAQLRAERQVQQAITSTGGAARLSAEQLYEMARALQAVTTFGDEDILQNVTAPLLTFTQVAGPEFERAQAAIIDMAALLGTDLQSATLQVGRALNDPIRGVSALSRAGVQFTDAQRDMIASMVEQNRVAEAQGVILAELEAQFGGQAAVLRDLPLGQWAALSNAIGDVKEQLGEQIVPFLVPLVEGVERAVARFGQLDEATQRNIVVFGGLAAVAGPVLVVLGTMVMGIGAVTTALTAMGVAAMANPIGLLIAVVAAGAALIIANWEPISAFFTDLWARIFSVFDGGLSLLPPLFQAAWSRVESVVQNWPSSAYEWGYLVGEALRDGANALAAAETWLSDLFADAWSGVESLVAEWRPQAQAWGRSTIEGLVSGIRDMFGDLAEAVRGLWPAIRDEILSWPGRLFDSGRDLITGLIDGLRSGRGEANSEAAGLMNGVIDSAEAAAEIQSPSRVFRQIGQFITEGLSLGIMDGSDQARGAMRSLVDDVASEGDRLTGIMAGMSSQAQSFGQGFASIVGPVVSGTQTIGDAFTQMFQRMASNSLSQGLQSIGTGLGSLLGLGSGGWLDNILPFADGGVVQSGRVHAFADGGVVGGPTMFPMRGATGLMGEAGPEAIMPLERMSGGKLGVRAVGQGQATRAQVDVRVYVDDAGALRAIAEQAGASAALPVAVSVIERTEERRALSQARPR